ncbi:MAG: ATP-binding protein [Nitrospirota bacterium]|nr:ATP-binding protein [Nitrospirota bacterium]MDH5775845.1 ATP-binding protein [Nitrospirota bacterium]
MANRLESTLPTQQQSTLQKILTSAVNEVGMEAALVAIMEHEGGPLIEQVSRGFSSREIRAILRALSLEELKSVSPRNATDGTELNNVLRLRMVTPGTKVALALPLKFGGRVYGTLVLARRENVALTKREKTTLSTNVNFITEELKKAGLFGSSVILGNPVVANEPLASQESEEQVAVARTYTNEHVQERIANILSEVNDGVSFDRGWVTIYDPLLASLEVLGVLGTQKRDLSPGQQLSLEDSASGWSVRHRKARSDNNLASTQGRFHDYKQLFKDKFSSTIVVPFFVRGRVAGTLTLASKNPNQFDHNGSDPKALESVTAKLVELFEDPSCHLSVMEPAPIQADPQAAKGGLVVPVVPEGGDVRKEERRVALQEVSSFLATEIREPIGFIRAQLEEITTDSELDFDSQTRVENAMRDMIRMETVLNEILDFAKPLELDRKLCRVQDLLDEAFSMVSTDLRVNRIEVVKKVPARLAQVRWDETKMQHVFLCIFKNAIEAMSPGGHLRVEVMLTRARKPELQMIIANDGVPIPAELVDKVFEPYFTTKRSGTGLGLATVKKVVEEHQGNISIASEPEKGTTVTILMPVPKPRTPYRPRRPVRRPSGGES